MSVVQYKKYFWLVDTIRSAGKITKEQIDRKWSGSRYNDKHANAIPESSFHRIRRDIEELFDITIECKSGYYFIAESDLNSYAKQWLLSQFAINQSLDASREMRDCIIYESIPEGTQYLTTIVNAISENRVLLCTHKRFDSDVQHVFYLSPLCLKVFKQRWYVLGNCTELDGTIDPKNPKIYSLDRVVSLETLEKTFKRPKNFDARAYFAPFYGVFCGNDLHAELVRVRMESEKDAMYLRTLPLHASQREPEPCVFEWRVAPTFDFIQQLRTYGSKLEVLAPLSLREQFAEEAKKLQNLYK